ncbi:MAG: chorismate mutase [Nanoarchaeota archaeon]
MNKDELDGLRRKIDGIDAHLLQLLAQRLTIGKEIGEYKKKHGLPIQNKGREKEIIKDRAQKLKGLGFDDERFVQELFELIMKKAREVQK